MLVLGWVTAWCKHSNMSVFSCRFHWVGTVSQLLCCRKENHVRNTESTMGQFIVTREIILHSSWCNKLIVLLGIKLGVKLEVKLGGKSKTGSKNSVLAFLEMHGRIRIGLPKTHGRIRIGLPKVHGRIRIGPPQVCRAICPHYISTVGEFQGTIAVMKEKHKTVLFERE